MMVKVYDFGVTDGGLPYMAMEFVPGEHLATRRPLPAPTLSRVFHVVTAIVCASGSY